MREVPHSEVSGLIGRPQRIVLAVTWDEANDRADIIPLGWKMNTSFKPLMFAISIGVTRYSHKLVTEQQAFVLAWPSDDMADAVLHCGTRSGRDCDKFAEAGLTALPATRVKAPLIGECVANLECTLAGTLDTGDHTIFVGEVVASHLAEENRRMLISIGEESGYDHLGGNNRYRFGAIRND